MYSIRLMAWIAAVAVAFRFGGIPWGVIAAVVAWHLSWSDRENAFGFAPFRVRIQFNADFFIETGIADEVTLVAPPNPPAPGEYWPRRDGIVFSVLRLGLTGVSDQNLIYWDKHRSFSTRISEFLLFEEFPHEADSLTRRVGKSLTTPHVELKQRAGALELWASSSGRTSDEKLAVVIPNCIFDAPRLRDGNVTQRKRETLLRTHGWEHGKAIDLGEYGRFPGDFRHRLVSVSVVYI